MASPCPIDPWGLGVTQNEYFSLSTHINQLLLVVFCDMTAGIGPSFWTHERTEKQKNRQTDNGWTNRRASYLDCLDFTRSNRTSEFYSYDFLAFGS